MFGAFFVLVFVFLMTVSMLGVLWSIYVLMEWRGAWRLIALMPLVISIASLSFYLWVIILGQPSPRSFGGWVLGGDLCVFPYMLLTWLAYRGFAGTEDQTTGGGAEA